VHSKFEQAFADQVDKLFEKDRTAVCENVDAPDWKYTILSAPFIEFPYATFDDELITTLKGLICKALAAQIRFHESKPAWAPGLPISLNAGRELKRNRDPRVQLVGYFGISQLMAQYDKEHPAFRRFCSGLLADERMPKNLREDPELRRMFPPKPIWLLARGGYWYEPETLRSWCDLMARIGASMVHKLDDPDRQEEVADHLFWQVLTPEVREMFK